MIVDINGYRLSVTKLPLLHIEWNAPLIMHLIQSILTLPKNQ